MKLRDYQSTGVDKLYDKWEAGKQVVLLIAPTGSGKTLVLASIAADFVEADMRVQIQVHRDKLIEQTREKLVACGVPEDRIGIQAGGYPEHPHRPLQICSQQTLVRRTKWKEQPFDLHILDEAHLTGFTTVGKETIRLCRERGRRMLPVTASPWRNSAKEGYEWCDDQVNLAGVQQLQDLGFLCRIRYFGLPSVGLNLKGVSTRMGDYATGELSNVCSDPGVIAATVREWKDKSPGRRTMAFCVDLKHCEAVRSQFEAEGIPALSITGDTPRKERQAIAALIEKKEAMVLCSCMALSEGADFPFVETALMLRPTKSKSLAIQQLGRIARPYQYPDGSWKVGLVLDQAGVVARHGFLEDIPPDLMRQLPREAKGGGGNPVLTKLCPNCSYLCRIFDDRCPECGHLFSDKVANTSKLVELVRKGVNPDGSELTTKAKADKMRRRYRALRKQAHAQALLPGWAFHRFRREFDRSPESDWDLHAVFEKPTPGKVQTYWVYLETLALRKALTDLEDFIDREMRREFGTDLIAGEPWRAHVDAA